MHNFDYLKKFVYPLFSKEIPTENFFNPVSNKEIEETEKGLGFVFPNDLKFFYKEIGSGCLRNSNKVSLDHKSYLYNMIMPPEVSARFYCAVRDREIDEPPHFNEEYYMSTEAVEDFEPGDLPFFEIGDSSSFLIMKPHSDNPNAVWADKYTKIEDSFERFIWRLYHEDPGYYGEIIYPTSSFSHD